MYEEEAISQNRRWLLGGAAIGIFFAGGLYYFFGQPIQDWFYTIIIVLMSGTVWLAMAGWILYAMRFRTMDRFLLHFTDKDELRQRVCSQLVKSAENVSFYADRYREVCQGGLRARRGNVSWQHDKDPREMASILKTDMDEAAAELRAVRKQFFELYDLAKEAGFCSNCFHPNLLDRNPQYYMRLPIEKTEPSAVSSH